MNEMSADRDRAAIEARLAAATPGPWYIIRPGRVRIIVHGPGMDDRICPMAEVMWPDGPMPNEAADAEFIAHAPGDVRWLLAEVRRLDRRVEELEQAASNATAAQIRYWDRADAAEAERDDIRALLVEVERLGQQLHEARAQVLIAQQTLRDIHADTKEAAETSFARSRSLRRVLDDIDNARDGWTS